MDRAWRLFCTSSCHCWAQGKGLSSGEKGLLAVSVALVLSTAGEGTGYCISKICLKIGKCGPCGIF